jgi:hypothetical protein
MLVRSRVGRRVAVLLALTGLLPLLALATATGWMLSAYLTRQEEASQRAVAKASAMAALDRLLDLEERLRGVAGHADAVPPASMRGVTALARLDGQGRAAALFGRLAPAPLDERARARLSAGRAVLLVRPRGIPPADCAPPPAASSSGAPTRAATSISPRYRSGPRAPAPSPRRSRTARPRAPTGRRRCRRRSAPRT